MATASDHAAPERARFPIAAILPFCFAYIIPAVVAAGILAGGWWTFSGMIFAYVLTPILDEMMPLDTDNTVPADPAMKAGHVLHRVLTWGWVPTQLGFIIWGISLLASGTLAPVEYAGITLSVGLLAAAGINVAHELMHRRDVKSRAVAEVLMTLSFYPHFCIEHILGHHVNVATPGDPASAPKGMSLYRFLPKTFIGSARSAWGIESRRVARLNIAWTLKDRRLRYPLTLTLCAAVAWAIGGWVGAVFFAVQGLVGATFLEVINYVEHYGLRRKEKAPGRYEPVQPHHSWNSAHRVTRLYLFSLPRHADHHHQAGRAYWRLRHIEDSPQLPTGYAGMMLLSFVPPLWRKVMDPRVDALNAR
ncbi:MAG: alkane 1-monooxygenase [Bradymonadia bacterium]